LHVLDTASALTSDDLVVSGIATDDRTERDHDVGGSKTSDEAASKQGKLKGTGRPGERNVPTLDPRFLERVEGALQQPDRDGAVKARTRNGDAQTSPVDGSF
jgi:hypothetical protein